MKKNPLLGNLRQQSRKEMRNSSRMPSAGCSGCTYSSVLDTSNLHFTQFKSVRNVMRDCQSALPLRNSHDTPRLRAFRDTDGNICYGNQLAANGLLPC